MAASNPSAFVLRFPRTVIVTFILLSVLLGWFTQYFRIDASADTLLSKGNQLYIQTRQMDQRFAPQEFILLAYQPTALALFSQTTFDDLESLSQQLGKLPRVAGVTHILNVPLLSTAGQLGGDINPDQFTWQAKHFSPEQMQQIFTDHPLFTDLLVNQQQTATAIQILFREDETLRQIDNQITNIESKRLQGELSEQDEQQLAKLKQQADPLRQALDKQRQQEIEQIYQLIKPYESRAKLYLGGAHVLGFELINIISADLVTFGSAIAGAICLLLWWFFGHWRWVVLPMLCCAVSVVATIGLFGAFDLRTTIISSNFIALQLILTLAIVVHLIVQYRQLASNADDASQKELVGQTLADKTRPCLYAGITTSVGFASLIFSGIQPVVSFGYMMILAMGMSLLVSLLLFPACLMLFKREAPSSTSQLSQAFLAGALRLVNGRPKLILSVGAMLAVISVGGLLLLNVENSFLNYFAKDTRVHQQLKFIDQQFGGTTALDVVVDLPDDTAKDGVELSAQSVLTLQKIQAVLRQYPASGNITSVVNFTELARQINDDKPLTEYELSALYHLLDNDLRERLLGAYYDPEHRQLRISTRVKDSTEGLRRADYLAGLREDFNANGIDSERLTLTNLFMLYQDILQRLFESQILTLGIVYVALYLILWLLFRHPKVALIALVPNVLCTLMILALMGYLAIPLDLMTITISAIAMGIAVDDTIHMVHHYRQQKDQNGDAMAHTFDHVGRAMLYTSSLIAVGFSLLAFSDFVPSLLFGLLTAAAMLFALLTDLLLLPVMLKRYLA